MVKELNLRGTGVAMVTPFNKDGSIDFQNLENLTNHLIEGGVEYLVVLGTTGETATLDPSEQNQVLDSVLKFNNGRIPLIAGFGGNNTKAVCEAISNRSMDGISAILSASPAYNKPSQQGIFKHYEALAACTELPIIIYNVPGRTSSNVSPQTTLELAHSNSQFIAVKEASGSIEQGMEIVRNKPKNFLVLSGEDGLTLPMLACGFDGVISVVANAYPKMFSQMVREGLDGNFEHARKLHYPLLPLIDLLFEEGNPAGVKECLGHLGIGGTHLRLPLTSVSKDLSSRIKSLVSELK